MSQKLTPAAQVSNSPPIEASSTATSFNPSIKSDALLDLLKVDYGVLTCLSKPIGVGTCLSPSSSSTFRPMQKPTGVQAGFSLVPLEDLSIATDHSRDSVPPLIRQELLATIHNTEELIYSNFEIMVRDIYDPFYLRLGYQPLMNIRASISELIRQLIRTWHDSMTIAECYRTMLRPKMVFSRSGINIRDATARVRRSIEASLLQTKAVDQSIQLNIVPLINELENPPFWHLPTYPIRMECIKTVTRCVATIREHIVELADALDEYERDLSVMQTFFNDKAWVANMQGDVKLLSNYWELRDRAEEISMWLGKQTIHTEGALNANWLRYHGPTDLTD